MADKAALVIYDADADGFGCAYAAWRRFKHRADYVEIGHGTNNIPEIAYDGYDIVYVCDLSFPKDQLENLREQTNVMVIDHHESVRPMLESLGYTVDTNRAACVQVWEHFFPDEPAPQILQYVADRDVWKWELEASDEVNNLIFLTDKTFDQWDYLNMRLHENFWEVATIGEYISEYREKIVNWIVKYVTKETVVFDGVTYWDIPTVCSPILHSEVGHRLLNMYPYALFVQTYVDEPGGTRKWSLRSEDHRLDVGKLAQSVGGGGHRNAAGYREVI